MKRLLLGLVCSAGMVLTGVETASDVTLYQTPAEGVVVTYRLAEEAIVTVDFLLDGESLGVSHVGGDVNRVVPAGMRRITWRPDAVSGVRQPVAAGKLSAKVTVWPKTNPPDYMAVDLMVTNVVRFYATTSAIPGGVASRRYKTTELLMRRIPAAGVEWRMGKASYQYGYDHYVKFSEDFYMGVYELTVKQAHCINGHSASSFKEAVPDFWVLPLDGVSWRTMRGGTDWPSAGHEVGEGLLAAFRAWTGLRLDLPTSSQWEFACRAGTSTDYWWGSDATDLAARMNYKMSGIGHPVEVGLYPPNPWGLYDMYGNTIEECLDYLCLNENYESLYDGKPETAILNPKGPSREKCNVRVTASNQEYCVRVGRGGGFSDGVATSYALAAANVHEYNDGNKWIGYRLVCPLPW